MRPKLEATDALVQQVAAEEPHGPGHHAASPAGRTGEVGDLVVLAVAPRRDHRAECDVAPVLGNRVVDAVARGAPLADEAEQGVEVAVGRPARHVEPAHDERVAHRLQHGRTIVLA